MKKLEHEISVETPEDVVKAALELRAAGYIENVVLEYRGRCPECNCRTDGTEELYLVGSRPYTDEEKEKQALEDKLRLEKFARAEKEHLKELLAKYGVPS
jgi:hypothetical protein